MNNEAQQGDRMTIYRIYFADTLETYYSVEAPTVSIAVCRAKDVRNALRINKSRTIPWEVGKIERIENGRIEIVKS